MTLRLTRIERTEEPAPLMAKAVVLGKLATMCFTPATPEPDFAAQTRQVFDRLDHYLALSGTDKSSLLTAQAWIRDVADYDAFVALWNEWVDPANPPALSIIGSHLARDTVWVEVKVQAWVPG